MNGGSKNRARWTRTLALTLVALALFAVPRPTGLPVHSRAVCAIDAMLDVFGPPSADAAGFSDAAEKLFLEWIFKQTSCGTSPTTLYVALHSADPGDTCASELSGGGYARAQLNPDTNNSTNTNWNAVDQASAAAKETNKLTISFPTATANWNSSSAIQFYSILTASSGGTCLLSGAITPSGVVVLNGNTLSFTGGSPGQLAFTVD